MFISIVANSQISYKSMGGSDKIFIEMAKIWKRQGNFLRIYGCGEAMSMCSQAGLSENFKSISSFDVQKMGLLTSYSLRTLFSLLKPVIIKKGILYSSSDFFPDLIFAFWQKIFNRRIKWVAGMYLVAPNPYQSSCARNLRGIIYWISQRLGIILMRFKADFISVLCQEDKAFLEKLGIDAKRIIVISGGVDFDSLSGVPEQKKQYQGCFLGRFHQQKGLPELIAIWKKVTDIIPTSKLALAGWGEHYWVDLIKRLVEEQGLKDNVEMKGFIDNQEKFKLLKASSVFIFPSSYESWGIVVAEALACGCPVVAFDIPAMRKFNKGVTLIDTGDLDAYAQTIVRLLQDDSLYLKNSNLAKSAALSFRWEDSAKAISQAVERGYA